MKKILNIVLILASVIFLAYLLLPNPDFPAPPPGALQSTEPADSETPLRRAYFTNLNRQEVIRHYENEFNKGFVVYAPRLNYPPEEAQTIIRDQTRSTYLEELVHPMRESLFVNGFEPKEEKDAINIEGKNFAQKIIIRYVPSGAGGRVIVLVLTLASALWLVREYSYAAKRN